ncbi:uncharacterized protein LOC111049829 isoform X2 [Nilaparvata lugens]|uniref:uncharacterized protein LOC111049829 isoform X2 n=1 Tax=Nilaparvata lugens TaxID=108931 RepID=UPI00193C926E|nr:uncharacterized protein LOC111049829 isoform X2 [Nilaparvata lugens]
MDEFEVLYESNGLYYNVIGTRELHDYLKSSPENAKAFFKENVGNLEVQGVAGSTGGVEDSSKGSPEFRWTHEKITLLLAGYKRRKAQFRDPKQKKNNLWRVIAGEFHALGHTSVTHDMVDNKFRNLKRTFTQIMDNQNKTGRETQSASNIRPLITVEKLRKLPKRRSHSTTRKHITKSSSQSAHCVCWFLYCI